MPGRGRSIENLSATSTTSADTALHARTMARLRHLRAVNTTVPKVIGQITQPSSQICRGIDDCGRRPLDPVDQLSDEIVDWLHQLG